jgi:hypothetical protein
MMSDLEDLILQTHQDQAERLNRIADRLEHLHRIFAQPKPIQSPELPPELSMPEVPFELSEKFEKAAFGNGQDMTALPLEEGLDAFFRYFKDVVKSISKVSTRILILLATCYNRCHIVS